MLELNEDKYALQSCEVLTEFLCVMKVKEWPQKCLCALMGYDCRLKRPPLKWAGEHQEVAQSVDRVLVCCPRVRCLSQEGFH